METEIGIVGWFYITHITVSITSLISLIVYSGYKLGDNSQFTKDLWGIFFFVSFFGFIPPFLFLFYIVGPLALLGFGIRAGVESGKDTKRKKEILSPSEREELEDYRSAMKELDGP
jgi:hypothetical protein